MQAVDRTFAVLRALAGSGDTSSLAEVAASAGLPKNTTSRFLAALERQGVVDRVGDRFALGAGLATLTHGATPVSSIRELCRPYLAELSATLGENASLGVADGNEVLYIDTVAEESVISMQDWTGYHVPFHATAAGLVMMSTWDAGRVEAHVAVGLSRLTPHTLTGLGEIASRLDAVRSKGTAWTFAEFSEEVNAVASAIVLSNGTCAGALSVFGPTFRFPGDNDTPEIDELMIDAAARVAARLEEA